MSDSNQRPRDYKSRALANWAKEAIKITKNKYTNCLLKFTRLSRIPFRHSPKSENLDSNQDNRSKFIYDYCYFALWEGFEPPTRWLTVTCSKTDWATRALHGNFLFYSLWFIPKLLHNYWGATSNRWRYRTRTYKLSSKNWCVTITPISKII